MPIEYNANDIQIISSAEVLRRRPDMYIGSLNSHVVNRLVQEILCLSIDDAICGCCTEIAVAVDSRGVITVRDNGPGLPMAPDRKGRILAEVLLTTVGACREAKRTARAKAASCHLGLVVVNAFSAWLRIRVFRDEACWLQEYRKGIAQAPFRRETAASETGLEFSFCPDHEILGKQEFDAPKLKTWLTSVGLEFEPFDYRPDQADTANVFLHFRGLRPSHDAGKDSCD